MLTLVWQVVISFVSFFIVGKVRTTTETESRNLQQHKCSGSKNKYPDHMGEKDLRETNCARPWLWVTNGGEITCSLHLGTNAPTGLISIMLHKYRESIAQVQEVNFELRACFQRGWRFIDDMISHEMKWYDMTWHDMIWYDMTWYDLIWYDMMWYVTQLFFPIQHVLYCVPCWPNIVKINAPARCPSCIHVKGAQSRQETFFLCVCFPRSCLMKAPSVLSVSAALTNCEPTRGRQILRAPRYVASKCRGNCGGLVLFCFVVVIFFGGACLCSYKGPAKTVKTHNVTTN